MKKSKNFRTEIYFVRGKMKKCRIPLIDGLEEEEFIRRNADDTFLIQKGHFDILHEREQARKMANKSLEPTSGSVTPRASTSASE